MIRTADNSLCTIENRCDFINLQRIANRSIDQIKPDEMHNLLVFPQKWQHGLVQRYGRMPKICSVFDDSGEYKISTGNVMGFIGITDGDGYTTELSISSRFYPNDNDFFLHYMLAKVLKINVVNLDLSKGTGNYYDFLPYLFPAFLKDALSQGLFRQYRQFNRNDANVRGVVDVSRHIRQNIPFAGKIAYRTREHSGDNSITQLVRHTIEHLRTTAIGKCVVNSDDETRQNVVQIEYATPTYKHDDRSKILRDNTRPLQHPYYNKYRNLQILCNLILRHKQTNFGNEKNKIHGILFDGAWLWEEYIAKVLQEQKSGIQHKTGTDKLFEKDDIGKNQGIIPDFIRYIDKPDTASFIGDTKYKHIDTKDNREDYFQILSYMFRYSCPVGCLIFPNDKDSDDPRKRILADGKNENKIIEIGLKIPQEATAFEEFVKRIQICEKELMHELPI